MYYIFPSKNSDTFEVGELVTLHEDEDFVREQFRIFDFDNGQIHWTEDLANLLGKTYLVVPKEVCQEDSNWVGLPSNDLKYGRTWYFPKTTLRKSKSFLIQFICITCCGIKPIIKQN